MGFTQEIEHNNKKTDFFSGRSYGSPKKANYDETDSRFITLEQHKLTYYTIFKGNSG
jgi:hypothetical protein